MYVDSKAKNVPDELTYGIVGYKFFSGKDDMTLARELDLSEMDIQWILSCIPAKRLMSELESRECDDEGTLDLKDFPEDPTAVRADPNLGYDLLPDEETLKWEADKTSSIRLKAGIDPNTTPVSKAICDMFDVVLEGLDSI